MSEQKIFIEIEYPLTEYIVFDKKDNKFLKVLFIGYDTNDFDYEWCGRKFIRFPILSEYDYRADLKELLRIDYLTECVNIKFNGVRVFNNRNEDEINEDEINLLIDKIMYKFNV